MDGARHEVLPDPALAAHQDGRVGVGDVVDDRQDRAHLRAQLENRSGSGEIVYVSSTGLHKLLL